MTAPPRRPSRLAHRLAQWLTATALIFGSALATAPTAAAHGAAITRSDPAAGTVVTAVEVITVELSGPIDPSTSSFSLARPDGSLTPVELDVNAAATSIEARPAWPLTDGRYRLGYQVVLADDGHPATGVVEFEVSAEGVSRAAPWPQSGISADSASATPGGGDTSGRAITAERFGTDRALPWVTALMATVLVAVVAVFVVGSRRRRR